MRNAGKTALLTLRISGILTTASAPFLGFEYRWADMQTTGNTEGLFDKRAMSGIGISAGFRVTL